MIETRQGLIPDDLGILRATIFRVHTMAKVESANIGDSTRIWAFASVSEQVQIGDNCTIAMYAHIGHGVKIGNGCKIQNGAQIFEGVTLADDVFIGPHAVFTNVLTPRAFTKAKEYKKTRVERGASIGANATILCGITIGAYAQVGAGTVVTKDVPPFTRVIGVPARASCKICKCGEALPTLVFNSVAQSKEKFVITCKACGQNLVFNNGNIFEVLTGERIDNAAT